MITKHNLSRISFYFLIYLQLKKKKKEVNPLLNINLNKWFLLIWEQILMWWC